MPGYRDLNLKVNLYKDVEMSASRQGSDSSCLPLDKFLKNVRPSIRLTQWIHIWSKLLLLQFPSEATTWHDSLLQHLITARYHSNSGWKPDARYAHFLLCSAAELVPQGAHSSSLLRVLIHSVAQVWRQTKWVNQPKRQCISFAWEALLSNLDDQAQA